MKALVTGASSGIGKSIAFKLAELGYDLILVGRREKLLKEVAEAVTVKTEIIPMDVSETENCIKLHEMCGDIDVLINNAGFGVFGKFDETDLTSELNMIKVNVMATHTLMKLFIKDFKKKNNGYILNVASSAAFFPGPLFSSYYASKAYIYRLTHALHRELKKEGSGVKISVLCPGPVATEFGEVANVHFNAPSMSADKVAATAVKGLLKGKLVIVPGVLMKIARVLSKLLPDKALSACVYHIQRSKKLISK